MIIRKSVSVIIVSYNVRELLFKCISSIIKFCSEKNDVEIIVVDNNSSDETVKTIKEHFPNIKIIANNFNAGFPAANNQALKIANGNFILLLNPDTELIEDSISILINFMHGISENDVAAPQLLNSNRTIQQSIYRFPRIKYIISEMFYLERLTQNKYYSERKFNEIFEVDSAAGAALFFNRKLIQEIGNLNEQLFWIEDVDFCYRVRKNGGQVWYVPLTKIIHHSGQSAKRNYNVSILNQVINKIKYFKVHGTKLELYLVYILSILNVLMRLIIFGILSPFKKIYFLKMKAYFYAFPGIFTATRLIK